MDQKHMPSQDQAEHWDLDQEMLSVWPTDGTCQKRGIEHDVLRALEQVVVVVIPHASLLPSRLLITLRQYAHHLEEYGSLLGRASLQKVE